MTPGRPRSLREYAQWLEERHATWRAREARLVLWAQLPLRARRTEARIATCRALARICDLVARAYHDARLRLIDCGAMILCERFGIDSRLKTW